MAIAESLLPSEAEVHQGFWTILRNPMDDPAHSMRVAYYAAQKHRVEAAIEKIETLSDVKDFLRDFALIAISQRDFCAEMPLPEPMTMAEIERGIDRIGESLGESASEKE